MVKQKVKLSIEKGTLVLFGVVAVIVAGSIFAYMYYQKNLAPVIFADFEGVDLPFRVDLRQAQKIEVTPNEETLRLMIDKPPVVRTPDGVTSFRQTLRNVTIVFKTVPTDNNGWYSVQTTEIIKKMTLLYKGKYGVDLKFEVREVESYDGLRGSNRAPVIALIHPHIANGTYVEADKVGDVIKIHGGDTLKDFDLATVKFMMVALNVTV